jgi:poly(A) polymerase
VRILRVLRFAAKLGFRIAPETEGPIAALSPLLGDIPPARLFEETLKLFATGHAEASLETLRRHDVLRYLFPDAAGAIARGDDPAAVALVEQAMRNTDARLAQERPVTPGFLIAALLWPPFRAARRRHLEDGLDPRSAFEQAAGDVVAAQVQHVAVPKRFSIMAREIWSLQERLERRERHDASLLLGHPRFRAAYDFLALRAEAGEGVDELVRWWTDLQALGTEEREAAIEALPRTRRRRRGPRRRGKRVA